VKNIISLLFSFLILYPSILSLEHTFFHEHSNYTIDSVNIQEPDLECLTCDYITNNLIDYSLSDDSRIITDYIKKDLFNKIKVSSKTQYLSYKKNRAPPYFI
jgi:competence CoiA-like predicted nuclease